MYKLSNYKFNLFNNLTEAIFDGIVEFNSKFNFNLIVKFNFFFQRQMSLPTVYRYDLTTQLNLNVKKMKTLAKKF